MESLSNLKKYARGPKSQVDAAVDAAVTQVKKPKIKKKVKTKAQKLRDLNKRLNPYGGY